MKQVIKKLSKIVTDNKKPLILVSIIILGSFYLYNRKVPISTITVDLIAEENPVNTTESEVKDFVFNSLTEMAILNNTIRNIYANNAAKHYGNSVKPTNIVNNVVIWRGLIANLNQFLYEDLGKTAGRYTKQQNDLMKILNKDFSVIASSKYQNLYALYSDILNSVTKEQFIAIFDNYTKDFNKFDDIEKIALAKIALSLEVENLTQYFAPIDAEKFKNHIDYILLGYNVYDAKQQKKLLPDTDAVLKNIDTSSKAILHKIEILMHVIRNDIKYNDGLKIDDITQILDRYYVIIDKKNNLETYQSYLSMAFAFKQHSDKELYNSYLLEALDIIEKYPQIKSNYFTLRFITNLVYTYINGFDFYNATAIYNDNYKNFNKYFAGQYSLALYFKGSYNMLLFYQDKKADGLKHARAMLNITEKLYTKKHPIYIETLNNVALFEVMNKDYTNSLNTLANIVTLQEETYGYYSEQHISALRNHADALDAAKKFKESIKLFKKIKRILKKTYGKNSPLYAYCSKMITHIKEKS